MLYMATFVVMGITATKVAMYAPRKDFWDLCKHGVVLGITAFYLFVTTFQRKVETRTQLLPFCLLLCCGLCLPQLLGQKLW